jgi:Uma2 family endonuclease
MQMSLTLEDLLERFGPIPAERIRHAPPPGFATEQDVIEIALHEDRLCELVDGVLVEKAMGFYESFLAGEMLFELRRFLEEHNLGIVAGADGMVKLAPGLVRIPDVSFISWSRLPGHEIPRDPVADLAPDLAVEILSKGNTKKEMDRKLADYFGAGVRLVWYFYPKRKTVKVYSSRSRHVTLTRADTLDGGTVLPGFTLPIDEFFQPPAPESRGK